MNNERSGEKALPTISVIVTTFNSAPFVERLIHSVRRQEGQGADFETELIVVDDCSTDGTRDVLSSLSVNWLSTGSNSGGPNRGRNLGLEKASGDYICIADHDDEWFPGKIRRMLASMAAAPIATCGYNLLDHATGHSAIRACAPAGGAGERFYAANATFLRKLRRDNKGQNTYLGGIMYHAGLKHIRFEETFGMIDYDWLLELFHSRTSVEVCEPLFVRHVYRNNLSLNEQYRLKDYQLSLLAAERYKKSYAKEADLAKKRINGSLARYYYVMENMPLARHYFKKAGFGLRSAFYLLTSFAGFRTVKRLFRVFG